MLIEIIQIAGGLLVLITAVWSGTKFHKFIQQLNDFEDKFKKSEEVFAEKLKDLKEMFTNQIKETNICFYNEISEMKKERENSVLSVNQHMKDASIHRDPTRDEVILTDIRDRLSRIENTLVGMLQNGINS